MKKLTILVALLVGITSFAAAQDISTLQALQNDHKQALQGFGHAYMLRSAKFSFESLGKTIASVCSSKIEKTYYCEVKGAKVFVCLSAIENGVKIVRKVTRGEQTKTVGFIIAGTNSSITLKMESDRQSRDFFDCVVECAKGQLSCVWGCLNQEDFFDCILNSCGTEVVNCVVNTCLGS